VDNAAYAPSKRHHGARLQTWGTPRAFFEALNYEFHFTMDGAATPENALLPRFSSSDALLPWEGERVFCNPPWSNIGHFVALAATAAIAVLLVPARVNAIWFHDAIALGAKVRFFPGRLQFVNRKDSQWDCCLLVFGHNEV
jgi:phage N-6-adenine-methyltransferase